MTDTDILRANRRRQMDRLGRKRRLLAQMQGQPTSLVPAGPIRARLAGLHDLGWSFEAIAAMYGTGTAAGLNLIATGGSLRCERRFEQAAQLQLTLRVPGSVGETMWVPTLGATRRVRALLALGWRHADISEAIGKSSSALAAHSYKRMKAIDWRIVDAAYERMSAAPGASTRTALRAQARGYVPPFAWRDIDDPNEKPKTTVQAKLDEHYQWMRGGGDRTPDPAVVARILAGEWRLECTTEEKAAVCAEWVKRGKPINELERLTLWRPSRYFKKKDVAAREGDWNDPGNYAHPGRNGDAA